MKTWMILSLACLTVAASAAHAQIERSAADSKTTQMNWDKLTNDAVATNANADALNVRMDKAVACGKKGMVYGPKSGKADSLGCVEAAIPTDVKNALNDLQTTSDKAEANVTHILTCNANGQIYNQSKGQCEGVIPASRIMYVQASSVQNKGNGKYAAYATVSCPNGSVLIACMGAVSKDISASCGGDCGYIGAGPISANTCMATVDQGGGAAASVWASCLKVDK